MEKESFEEIGDYILMIQSTAVQYIAPRLILDLYEKTVWRPGYWVAWRWW